MHLLHFRYVQSRFKDSFLRDWSRNSKQEKCRIQVRPFYLLTSNSIQRLRMFSFFVSSCYKRKFMSSRTIRPSRKVNYKRPQKVFILEQLGVLLETSSSLESYMNYRTKLLISYNSFTRVSLPTNFSLTHIICTSLPRPE